VGVVWECGCYWRKEESEEVADGMGWDISVFLRFVVRMSR